MEPATLQLRRRQCFWLWVCGTATAALLMIASSAAADSSAKFSSEPFVRGATEPVALEPPPMPRA